MSVVERARGIAGCLDFAITADPARPRPREQLRALGVASGVAAVRGSSPSGKQAAAMLSASVAEDDIADVQPSFVSTARRHGEAS